MGEVRETGANVHQPVACPTPSQQQGGLQGAYTHAVTSVNLSVVELYSFCVYGMF